jgi:short-subunit dehydrogenase
MFLLWAYSLPARLALEGYTLALRQEVRQLNIHVSLVLPGPIHAQF